jgi:hypothetical protein
VESDCLNLIHGLSKVDETHSLWAGILSEIKATCALIPSVKFQHVRREANLVAHELSKLALVQRQCIIW